MGSGLGVVPWYVTIHLQEQIPVIGFTVDTRLVAVLEGFFFVKPSGSYFKTRGCCRGYICADGDIYNQPYMVDCKVEKLLKTHNYKKKKEDREIKKGNMTMTFTHCHKYQRYIHFHNTKLTPYLLGL